jgi:hypothetical protein
MFIVSGIVAWVVNSDPTAKLTLFVSGAGAGTLIARLLKAAEANRGISAGPKDERITPAAIIRNVL